VVFMPSVIEMYPEPEVWHIDLGPAEFLLEGEFRKGHYQGVTQIVKKLFDAVNPDVAFFGQKDFQQVLMIKNMVAHFNMPIQIVSCPIIREDDGLAMSSRNIHLSFKDRKNALVLSKALAFVKDSFSELSIPELVEKAKAIINDTPGVELDYFIVANGETLLPENDKSHHDIVALVAAKVGETRLIDNMILN
jgi:pantoate--beta-alanine ligase